MAHLKKGRKLIAFEFKLAFASNALEMCTKFSKTLLEGFFRVLA